MQKAAIIIGRFNPPTIGHYKLIGKVKQFVKTSGSKFDLTDHVFIVIVDGEKSSLDHTKNPLSAGERLGLMSKNSISTDCTFLIAKNAVDGFNKMREKGFEPVLIAGGEDRVKSYIDVLHNFDPSIDRIEFSMKRTIIDPEKSENLLNHINQDDTNMMSASLARHAVKTNDLKSFETITGLSGEPASSLFNKIKQRISNEKP